MARSLDGVLVIDKPVGPTSHDVVARMRRLLGESRVGHLGTLDPAASGVLPLVIGSATRLARFLSAGDKEYVAIVQLGVETTTYDGEGERVGTTWSGPLPSRAEIDLALDAFRGPFDQQPPLYAAKKVDGQRSYRLARRSRGGAGATTPGSDTAVVTTRSAPASCRVATTALDVIALNEDRLTLRLACSAGFYVRSLAHDLGQQLGTGAHLAALRRTRSGGYRIDDALALEAAEGDRDRTLSAVIPPGRLLVEWPAIVLSPSGVVRAAQGRDVGPADTEATVEVPADAHVRLLDGDGRLVAIAEPAQTRGLLHPAVVFV